MNPTNQASPEQLLAEIEDLQRSRSSWIQPKEPEALEWMGRAQAVVHQWDGTQSIFFDSTIKNCNSGSWNVARPALLQISTVLARARHDLLIRTSRSGTRAIEKGNVFDYFDELRKVIQRASSELFFIDPYLSADFVSRYMPFVSAGVLVRLLGRDKMTMLVPAVEMMRAQSGLNIEVRYAEGFHDRWLLLDRAECFSSGASFGEGAKKAPTTLTPVLDALPLISSTYESAWAAATLR